MAKLFLESTDTAYKVSSNNTTVFGATGDQAVTIDTGLTNISLDANVERVQFTGSTTDYKYVQAGTDLKVYNAAGALVTTVGLQDDTTGTQLTFANGTVKAAIVATAGAAPTLSVGGSAVTAIGATAAPVAVVPATIDGTVSSAPAAVFSVSAPTTSVTEATGATASFTVSLNAAQPAATTVKVATGSVGGSTATLDYGLIALTPVTGGATLDADGTVHFPAGITTATITVPVVADSVAESGEGVSLTLSAPSTGATVGTATASVSIADPATPIFSLAASATSAVEGTPIVGSVAAATAGTVTLTVTRSGNLTGTDSVDLTATPGTALASDYGIAATTGQTGIVLPKVTFAPTETTKTITFTPVADSIREANETLTVSLTNASTGSSISTTGASVALTITDDDANLLPVVVIPTTTPSAFISESTAVTGISFTDADDNIGFEVTVTAAGASQVSFSDLTTGVSNVVTAKNTAGTALAANQTANSIVLAGTKTDVNVVLSKLKYTTNSTSPTSEALTIAVKDTAGGVTTKTLAINIGQSGQVSSTTSLLGTSGDDSFSGTLAQFTTFSTALLSITGGLGSDKLTLTAANGALPTPTAANVTGVEILDLTTTTAGVNTDAVTFSASKFDASLTTVNFTTNNGTANTADANDTLTATNANAGTTFNIQNTAGTLAISAVNATTPTTSDAFTVNLAGGVTLSTLSGGSDVVDILNINSNGTAANIISTLTLNTAGTLAATINAGGTQALTITNALPNLGTGAFNGANALGKITVTANSSDNAAITGGSAGDVLTGDNGLDTISGGAGNDTINGGAAADLITGGTGADSITGGAGVNTFVFAPGDSGSTSTTRDIITDLKTSDVIKFSGYGVTALTNATNIGTSAASSTTKEIYVSAVNSTNAKIVIETSADGSTFEEIYIPASYANASFVYSTNSTVDISDDFITVGTAPLVKTNLGLGTLTLTGNTIAAVTVTINDSASPQVGGETISGGIVRTLDASNVTSFGVIVTGSAGNDTITASPQDDTITGGVGSDSITGGLGADSITGGSGADSINLGVDSAADTLEYAAVDTTVFDTITNFTVANDLIDWNVALKSDNGTATAPGAAVSAGYLAVTAAAQTTTITGAGAIVVFEFANAADELGEGSVGTFSVLTATQTEIKAEVIKQLATDATVALTTGTTNQNLLFAMYDESGNAAVINFIENEGVGTTIDAADTIQVVGVFSTITLGALTTANFM